MPEIKVLHCFNQYLNITENWMYRMIRYLPGVHNIILSGEFLKNNFYEPSFEYILKPKHSIKQIYLELDKLRQQFKKNPLNYLLFRIAYHSVNFLNKNNKYNHNYNLVSQLQQKGIHLIHSHFSFVGWDALFFAKALKVPHIISFYGFDYENLPHTKPIWKERYQQLFREVEYFICEGSFGASILIKNGCNPQKVKVARLGVNTEEIDFIKRDKKADELKLIQIASFTEKKGHKFTIDAFMKALVDCPNMSLTFVGRGNKDIIAQINGLIKKNKLEDKINIIQGIDFSQLHNFLADFDVFIHPSCYTDELDCEGGAPIVLLDAQATGMPVISTRHCDIPDEVIHEKTGLLSSEKDVDSIAQNIKTFYTMNLESYKKFSINARKHIEDNFNSKKNSAKLADLYAELLKSRK